MEDDDDRLAGLALQVDEQVEQVDPVTDVEERRRFVEQEQVRVLGEDHRDPHPLALAAGELGDRPVREAFDEARVLVEALATATKLPRSRPELVVRPWMAAPAIATSCGVDLLPLVSHPGRPRSVREGFCDGCLRRDPADQVRRWVRLATAPAVEPVAAS